MTRIGSREPRRSGSATSGSRSPSIATRKRTRRPARRPTAITRLTTRRFAPTSSHGTVHLDDKSNLKAVHACSRDSWLCKIPIGATFDINDWAMRSSGNDPYASAKLKMLDETRDERVAIGTQFRKELLAHSVEPRAAHHRKLLGDDARPGRAQAGAVRAVGRVRRDRQRRGRRGRPRRAGVHRRADSQRQDLVHRRRARPAQRAPPIEGDVRAVRLTVVQEATDAVRLELFAANDPMVPTITPEALESIRLTGDRNGPLDPKIASTLGLDPTPTSHAQFTWIKICLDQNGRSRRRMRARPRRTRRSRRSSRRRRRGRSSHSRSRDNLCSMVRMAYPAVRVRRSRRCRCRCRRRSPGTTSQWSSPKG